MCHRGMTTATFRRTAATVCALMARVMDPAEIAGPLSRGGQAGHYVPHGAQGDRHPSRVPRHARAAVRGAARWPELTPLGSFELHRPGETEPEGVGAVRLFRTPPFASYEQIVELEPDRRFSYALLRGFPVRDYRVGAVLTPVDGGTELHWHCEFSPKIPGTGWFYRWFFGQVHAKVVAGLGAGATA